MGERGGGYRILALAVAGLLLTAWPALAQRGGRGGGGGHAPAAGSYHGGSYGGRSFNGGYGRYGYDRDRGFRDFDRSRFGYGYGFGYPGYFPGYDYPWYGYPYAGFGYGPPVLPGYGVPYPPPDYTAAYLSPAMASSPVLLNVTVPAGAELWVDGHKTSQSGGVRQFTSPPLPGGKDYQYELRARWKEGGHTVEQARTVHFHAGDHLDVNLAKADKK